MDKPKIVFFGTPEFSVKILEAMKNADYVPVAVVTAPDKPRGRKMLMTPTPVKTWAEKNNISVQHDPSNLKSPNPNLFIVASYGKILPKEILDIPKHGTLNVHPSLLPKLRGPSPIQTAILQGEEKTGVTIMLLNERMDEGPILAQQELSLSLWDIGYPTLEGKLAELGGQLLTKTIPKWLSGKIKPIEQNDNQATYSKIIKKSDGEINWSEPPEIIERKIRAYTPWPSAYTFDNGKRIIITKAHLNEQGEIIIDQIKPEGKKEMNFLEFLKNSPDFIHNNQAS